MGRVHSPKRGADVPRVDLLLDLKLERLPDGKVRVYAPDRQGGLHVFQSTCDGPDCCDGCLIDAAFEAFDFATVEELEKRGVDDARVFGVLRLNGVPFAPGDYQ